MFFSVFYISINIGSLVSMLLTPILREDVHCFGSECYPLAFGVPAGLFLVATAVFVIGTPLYINKEAAGESMIVKACGAVGSAIKNRIEKGKTEDKFLYHASRYYDVKIYPVSRDLNYCFIDFFLEKFLG